MYEQWPAAWHMASDAEAATAEQAARSVAAQPFRRTNPGGSSGSGAASAAVKVHAPLPPAALMHLASAAIAEMPVRSTARHFFSWMAAQGFGVAGLCSGSSPSCAANCSGVSFFDGALGTAATSAGHQATASSSSPATRRDSMAVTLLPGREARGTALKWEPNPDWWLT